MIKNDKILKLGFYAAIGYFLYELLKKNDKKNSVIKEVDKVVKETKKATKKLVKGSEEAKKRMKELARIREEKRKKGQLKTKSKEYVFRDLDTDKEHKIKAKNGSEAINKLNKKLKKTVNYVNITGKKK